MNEKVKKTDEQWRAELSPEQYQVCRCKGTERAFTGAYYAHKEDGLYLCSCCGEPVFDSSAKYDSGTGWPSFRQPLHEQAVSTLEDRTLGMLRTEVHCRACGAHLGHVFPDGPRPTGLRYCINSVSLAFNKRDGLTE